MRSLRIDLRSSHSLQNTPNRWWLLLVVATVAFPTSSRAQVNWSQIDEDQKRYEQTTSDDPQLPPGNQAIVVDPHVQKAYDDYTIGVLTRRSETFAWQLTASKIIFWMVLTLVAVGVIFSGIQFWSSRHRRAPTMEVEVSLQKVRLRSQFLGLVTLTLALAFFYLYLSTVYRISETP